MLDNPILLVSLFFVVLSLILLVVLVFLYKLALAVGRLDRRLEKLARHLRDLNLYDLQPAEMAEDIFGPETEMESGAGTATDAMAGPAASDSDTGGGTSGISPTAPTGPIPTPGGKTPV